MKKSVYIISGLILGSTGVVGALSVPTQAADGSTSITATVGKTITCSGMQNASVASEITPGQAGTATMKIGATTNSVSGFTITAGDMPSLASGSNTIAMNTSAAAGTQGWKGVPATTSEWSALGTGSTIAKSSVWTNSATTDTESITITVGTTTSTPSGQYSGTISWTCAAK